MISIHFSHKNSTNPSIHAKHVECNYFLLLSKFEMLFSSPMITPFSDSISPIHAHVENYSQECNQ
jgi:hypothetical protein